MNLKDLGYADNVISKLVQSSMDDGKGVPYVDWCDRDGISAFPTIPIINLMGEQEFIDEN